MQLPFFKSWTPRIGLNTDMVPIEKFGAVIPAAAVEGVSPVSDFASSDKSQLADSLNKLGFSTEWIYAAATAVVISALDEDPVITANQQYFLENPGLIKDAALFVKALTGASRVILAVPAQYKSFAEARAAGAIEIVPIDAVYPNGIPSLLSQKIPGCNAASIIKFETACAMVKSLKEAKPMQVKILTIAAPHLGILKNVAAPLGTPASDILAKFKISLKPGQKMLLNGVMKGTAAWSPDAPIAPDTDGIYIQEAGSTIRYEDNQCINCGKCNAACPVSLQANAIGRNAEYSWIDRCEELGVDDCIECGLCAWACPAHRPLVQYMMHAKSKLLAMRNARKGSVT